MYAVIKTGGKQYRVTVGQKIIIEQILADVGAEIVLDQVLALIAAEGEIQIGTPLLDNVVIKANIIRHGKHDKIRIFKMRRRKHYQKHQGHRQRFTEIEIISINA